MGCIECTRKEPNIVIQINTTGLNGKSIKSSNSNNTLKINGTLFVSEQHTDFFKKYEIISKLGEGSFGKVHKIKQLSTGNIRALKIIDKKHISLKKEEEKKLLNEIEILTLLDHPNIIKVYEYFNTEDTLFIVLEYCSGGELYDKITKYKKFSEKESAYIIKQLLSAICFCHSRNIIHRDIKPENILIKGKNDEIDLSEKKGRRKSAFKNFNEKDDGIEDKDVKSSSKEVSEVNIKKENMQASKDKESSKNLKLNQKYNKLKKENSNNLFDVKIIDFGTSLIKNTDFLKEKTGTAYYIAPEVIKNKYDEKCDIWSLGVIMYILLSGEPPFSDENDDVIFKKILLGKYNIKDGIWKNISNSAKNLIKKLLTYDSNKRPSARDLLENDDWILEHSKDSAGTELDENTLKSSIMKLSTLKNGMKLQQTCIGFIIHNLENNDEINKLLKIFKMIDSNGDGQITKEELKDGLEKELDKEIDEREISRIMAILDNDGSGYIEFQEFLRACINKKKLLDDKNLKYAFELFDISKKGKFDYKDLKRVLNKNDNNLSDEELKEIIFQVNKSEQTDFISFDQFKKMMLD